MAEILPATGDWVPFISAETDGYERSDGAKISRRFSHKEDRLPWVALSHRGCALSGRPRRKGIYGQVRRFGTAISAVLAFEEAESKRDVSFG